MASVPSLWTPTKVTAGVSTLTSTPRVGSRRPGSHDWTKLPVPLGSVALGWHWCHGTHNRHRRRVGRTVLRARPKDPPPPWNLVEAPAGSIKSWYYWNQETGETSWDAPKAKEDTQASASRWRAVNRPEDGAVYYYNEVTMETSWSLPKDAVLVDDPDLVLVGDEEIEDEIDDFDEQAEEDFEEEAEEEDFEDEKGEKEEEAEKEEEDFEKEEVEDVETEEDVGEAEASPSTGSRAIPASQDVDYTSLTVAELRKILVSRGLVQRGRKAELIARLQESEGEAEEAAKPNVPEVSKTKREKKKAKVKKGAQKESSVVRKIPTTAAGFLEQELGLTPGALSIAKDVPIDQVKFNLNFLMEELMPSKDFWAEAALADPSLFTADVDEMHETLTWLEEFLWNQDWAVGFGRQALAERIRHQPTLLLQGVEELTKTLAWLEERGLVDEVVRSYVAGPTAVPYPCEPYPWIEFLQLGAIRLEQAEAWLMEKRKWTASQVSTALCQEPYILLTAATACGVPSKPYPGYPLEEPRESWLQTHAAQATSG